MVRIAISQAAFDAIAATMALGSVSFENTPAPKNEVSVWLDHATVATLRICAGRVKVSAMLFSGRRKM